MVVMPRHRHTSRVGPRDFIALQLAGADLLASGPPPCAQGSSPITAYGAAAFTGHAEVRSLGPVKV